MKKIIKDRHSCKKIFNAIFNSINEQKGERLDSRETTNKNNRGQTILNEDSPVLNIYCIYFSKVKLFKTGYLDEKYVIRLPGLGGVIGFRASPADKSFSVAAPAGSDARFISHPGSSLLIVMIVNIFSISMFFDVQPLT
ncbi:MAG: hypothetical protein JSW64_12830 [Candidatus Zixiibacteriota bacterium]|nr:MAG: hypothetical protein JSW64_12830 [candidate division Zixibacteria bacterium]